MRPRISIRGCVRPYIRCHEEIKKKSSHLQKGVANQLDITARRGHAKLPLEVNQLIDRQRGLDGSRAQFRQPRVINLKVEMYDALILVYLP